MSSHLSAPNALLSFLEARVLAVLIEKEKTTPDLYPLTVNSLTSGCNQKSARDPVISVSENEVQAVLEDLRQRLLVRETYGASGRVLRYAHNVGKVFGIPAASVALLAVLVLRGPQTVSELRANSERLYRFDDSSSVEGYLEELAARNDGELVGKLPRPMGAREHRWMHWLCGEPLPSSENDETVKMNPGQRLALEQRVACLEEEVVALRMLVEKWGGAPRQGC